MNIDLKKHKDELLFLPLGGAGEIGLNFNLYYYEGKWLIVDCGAGFAEDNMPGVDILVPNAEFISQYKEDILGIVVTHIHEDHIGAIQYIWEELKCPVYTTPLGRSFLKAKLVEYPFARQVKIQEVQPGSELHIGPFTLDMVELTHSTPEMNALVIKTKFGNILHTGDWKFDNEPIVGPVSDYKTLKDYGDDGILALIGDSTNIFKEGTSGSEGDLQKSLFSLITEQKNLVVVTTFASNVARIETIAQAAKLAGRRIIVMGRSLWRLIECARDCGYLKGYDFLTEKQFGDFKRSELLLICTGCQGEELAITNKLASNSHPKVRLIPNDTVIFSSKIIPGNDKRIFSLFNKFLDLGIEVITEKDHFVHVSGHPSRDEVKKMYELVRPKYAIPVHGELVHLHEHAKFARSLGVEKAYEVKNGDLYRLAPNTPQKIATVKAGYFGVDGTALVDPKSQVMSSRRKISKHGFIGITLLCNKDGYLLCDPVIFAPGILDEQIDTNIKNNIKDAIYNQVEGYVSKVARKSVSNLTLINQSKSIAKKIITDATKKSPLIEIQIERVNS